MSKLFHLFICFLVPAWYMPAARGQEDAVVRNIGSYLSDNLPAEADLSQLTERLSFLRLHPIDLNHTSAGQLQELPFLSALQISNFFLHLHRNGKLLDILELQSVPGFDPETILRLSPFVTLKTAPEQGPLQLKDMAAGRHEILMRYSRTLEKAKGYEDLPGSHYTGSPDKLLLKYKYSLRNQLSFSLTAAKDAGETFPGRTTPAGFDFISFSLARNAAGRWKQIVIGDYSLQFGQGLSLWTGTSFGKGPDVTGLAKKDAGLKPYSSTSISSFFRGAAATYSLLKNIDLTSFISYRSLDASLNKSVPGNYTVTTIGTSGLHRTAGEISGKGSLQQWVYGSALQYKKDLLRMGFTAYHASYNRDFIKGKAAYRAEAFEGRELSNFGFHYSYTFRNLYFFGEAASSLPGGAAVLSGAMASLSGSLSAVILYREYAKDHISFYGEAAGAGSNSVNERGAYTGIHWSSDKKWNAAVYTDLFRFPGAKYRIDSASSGHDLLFQAGYSPRKSLKVLLRTKLESGEQNSASGSASNRLMKLNTGNYRLDIRWQMNRKTQMENRLEVTRFRKGSSAVSYGFLVFQDAEYSAPVSGLNTGMRLALFSAASYENRIYAYEDDVLYGAGSGLYYRTGMRCLLNLSYRLSAQLRVWLRYAMSWYPGEESLGTGLDEIQGNRKTEIKAQLRYQF